MLYDIRPGQFVELTEVDDPVEYHRHLRQIVKRYPNLFEDLSNHYDRHHIPCRIAVQVNAYVAQTLMALEEAEAPLAPISISGTTSKRQRWLAEWGCPASKTDHDLRELEQWR